MDQLRADPPDWLLTSQLHGQALDETTGAVTPEAMVNGLRQAWAALTPLDVKVVVVADNPGPGKNIYECVERFPGRMSSCAFNRDNAKSAAATQHRAVEGQKGVTIVDLNDAVCPTARCAPVIGNVLIYRDASHITATYVRSLMPRMAEALKKAGMPVESPAVS
jgi:hypothetical protein